MRRFLISRLSALGDVVCTLPAACALKRTFPDCKITWVADPRFAGIVDRCTAVDEVVRAQPKWNPASWPKLEGEFDVALDLQGLAKSGLVVARAKAKRKLGYHWQREGSWLFSRKVVPAPTSIHVVEQYLDVAYEAGAQHGEVEFCLVPATDDVDAMRSATSGVAGPLIVLNPGAGWASKRWPPAHFAQLADLLAEQGFSCCLIGSKAPADRAAIDEVLASAQSKPLDLGGQTSVPQLIALMSIAKAHVGGDTGSSHIAAALRVPAVGLYSITMPERSCPYGQMDRCHYDAAGLANIQPVDVAKTVNEALG